VTCSSDVRDVAAFRASAGEGLITGDQLISTAPVTIGGDLRVEEAGLHRYRFQFHLLPCRISPALGSNHRRMHYRNMTG
jgi:hypothetical protein